MRKRKKFCYNLFRTEWGTMAQARIGRVMYPGESMSKVSVKIRNIVSPYAGEYRGRRIVAAIPNQEGRAFGKVCTSYDKPYLVYHGLVVDDADITRHLEILQSIGYDEFHADVTD